MLVVMSLYETTTHWLTAYSLLLTVSLSHCVLSRCPTGSLLAVHWTTHWLIVSLLTTAYYSLAHCLPH